MAKKKPNLHSEEYVPHDYSWLAEIIHKDYIDWIKRRLMAGEPLRQIDYQVCKCKYIWLNEDGKVCFE